MSVSDARMAKELEAQKKRVQALQYLEKQGQSVGPMSIERIEENKKKSDNTLDLLLKQKVMSMSKTNVEKDSRQALLMQQATIRETETVKTSERAESISKQSYSLPIGWKEVTDPVSKKSYYWNTVTNETSWDRPNDSNIASVSAAAFSGLQIISSSSSLPLHWVEKIHTATKQTFYQNTVTGATSFTRPMALSASETTTVAAAAKGSVSSGVISSNVRSGDGSVSSAVGSKRARDSCVDPLDPGGRGSNGTQDGRMADSTAGGALWQQRYGTVYILSVFCCD